MSDKKDDNLDIPSFLRRDKDDPAHIRRIEREKNQAKKKTDSDASVAGVKLAPAPPARDKKAKAVKAVKESLALARMVEEESFYLMQEELELLEAQAETSPKAAREVHTKMAHHHRELAALAGRYAMQAPGRAEHWGVIAHFHKIKAANHDKVLRRMAYVKEDEHDEAGWKEDPASRRAAAREAAEHHYGMYKYHTTMGQHHERESMHHMGTVREVPAMKRADRHYKKADEHSAKLEAAHSVLTNAERYESVDEVSAVTLGSYVKKAANQEYRLDGKIARGETEPGDVHTWANRRRGVRRALDRLDKPSGGHHVHEETWAEKRRRKDDWKAKSPLVKKPKEKEERPIGASASSAYLGRRENGYQREGVDAHEAKRRGISQEQARKQADADRKRRVGAEVTAGAKDVETRSRRLKKMVKEMVLEGRGRPKKSGAEAEDPDEHPVMQLKKTIALRGQHMFKFRDGKTARVSPEEAHRALDKHDRTDRHGRADLATRLGHSHKSFRATVNETDAEDALPINTQEKGDI